MALCTMKETEEIGKEMSTIVLNIRLKFMRKVYLNVESVKGIFGIIRTGFRNARLCHRDCHVALLLAMTGV
jgi:hypothetical protein